MKALLNRLLGKLRCRLARQHLRGKRIAQDQASKTYECPRCQAKWTRPISVKRKANAAA